MTQLNLLDQTAFGYTVDGTFVRQIPPRCNIRFHPDVPDAECNPCHLATKIHWCDPEGNKFCTKDILQQKAFEFDLEKWLQY